MSEGDVRIRFFAEGAEDLRNAIDDIKEGMSDTRGVVDDATEAWKRQKAEIREAISDRRALRNEVLLQNQSFYDSIRVMQDVGHIFNMVGSSLTRYNIAQIRIEEANRALADAQKKLNEAQEEYNKLMNETFEDTDEYIRLNRRLEDLRKNQKASAEDIQRAEEDLNRAREKWTREHADKIAQAQERIVKSQEEVKNATDRVTRSHQELQALIISIAGSAIPSFLGSIGNMRRDWALLINDFGAGGTAVTESFGEMSIAAGAGAGGIMSALGPLIPVILAVAAVVVALKIAWDNNLGGIQEKAAAFAKGVSEILGGFFDWLKGIWEEIKPFVFDALGSAIQAIWDLFSGLWEEVLKPLLTWLWETFGPVLKILAEIWILNIVFQIKVLAEVIKFLWHDILHPFITFVKDVFISALNSLKSAIEPVINFIKGFIDIVRGAINAIKDFLGLSGQATGAASEAGKAMEGMKGGEGGETPAMQYGGVVPLTRTYRLEAGEVVLNRNMLADLINYSRRFSAVYPSIPTAVGGREGRIVNINAPLLYVQGHVDERLAREVSERILREVRRVVSVY
jgi:hypothetical protein